VRGVSLSQCGRGRGVEVSGGRCTGAEVGAKSGDVCEEEGPGFSSVYGVYGVDGEVYACQISCIGERKGTLGAIDGDGSCTFCDTIKISKKENNKCHHTPFCPGSQSTTNQH
jgi:hypothetical protein